VGLPQRTFAVTLVTLDPSAGCPLGLRGGARRGDTTVVYRIMKLLPAVSMRQALRESFRQAADAIR